METKQILVFGEKTFRITVPTDARITFGPWSPPTESMKNYAPNERALAGTLRVYGKGAKTTENILAVFSGVRGFRDLSLGYSEMVAREEGATIWKDDENGYVREDKVKREQAWIVPQIGAPNEEGE